MSARSSALACNCRKLSHEQLAQELAEALVALDAIRRTTVTHADDSRCIPWVYDKADAALSNSRLCDEVRA